MKREVKIIRVADGRKLRREKCENSEPAMNMEWYRAYTYKIISLKTMSIQNNIFYHNTFGE